MNAAQVEDFKSPPRFRSVDPPQPNEDELLLRVKAAALSNLVRSQADGSHYSSSTRLPFTPGNDGVGITPDGERVYFMSPRAPFGSMAEYTAVSANMMIPLPKELDDVTAAALGNPGLATWGALLGRARLQPGEVVLIHGATGIAGRQAIQVARYLGASKIIATGRNEQALDALRELGANELISLKQPDDALLTAFKSVVSSVQVVLDYLWGPSAEILLKAAGGHGSSGGEPRMRFVQVGSISGNTITLAAQTLRSSGVELLGSGLGSLSSQEILSALQTMYAATSQTSFVIETEAVPLKDVEQAWTRDTGERRLVFLPAP